MSELVANRDRPVKPVNRKLGRPAFACFTQDDYKFAEAIFRTKYTEMMKTRGPWTPLTIACLNNYITALIKVYNYEKAEEVCRANIQVMASCNLKRLSCFTTIRCSLAAALFLSGQIIEAFNLYETIVAELGTKPGALEQDYLDVLSLTLFTHKDCLVFRDSPVTLEILVPVTDYVTQLEGLEPRTSIFKSSLGSLRRIASFNRSASTKGTQDSPIDRPVSLMKKIFGYEKLTRETAPPEPLDAPGRVVKWLVDQIENSPTPHSRQPPPRAEEPYDPTIGMTYRSISTTSSNLDGAKSPSVLAITAWAADLNIRCSTDIDAKLDTGASKNLISENFAVALNAPIEDNVVGELASIDGRALTVLGSTHIMFTWKTAVGSQCSARIRCCVVRDSQIALVLCEAVIFKHNLFDYVNVQAPVIYTKRTKKEKHENASNSTIIAAARHEDAQRAATERAAERARIATAARAKAENADRIAAASATVPKPTRQPRADSPLGGSDTTVTSDHSSMTFSCRANTASTTVSSHSARELSSRMSQRSHQSRAKARTTTNSSSPSENAAPSHKNRSSNLGHRRSNAQYWPDKI